ncbi:uncharacterized protein [Drosophila virilis]|uniref:C3H1-type domain-containing protein n=1 Tax=Drosophila virilis TaxID=7244 RepID=B4LSB0_DROVI|nr:uncharacterized protein LOC6628958 [Drosophila virilis]EDW63718.1 uncharacterized protein Dvir_GJ16258 [Drosophila virilis]
MMSTPRDKPKQTVKVEPQSTNIKTRDIRVIKKEFLCQTPPSLGLSDKTSLQLKLEKAGKEQVGIRKDQPDISRRNSKKPAAPRTQSELEDGEVDDDEELLPVCRFHQRNSCTWGNSCRFRHPRCTDLGNYVMFERVNLPVASSLYDTMANHIYSELPLPPPPDWLGYPPELGPELESSFQSNLQSLKKMMRQAGYKVGNSVARRHKHQPWVEFNDLDTDPYYTHQHELPDDQLKERSPLLATRLYKNRGPGYSSNPNERCRWPNEPGRQVRLQYSSPSPSSSSSTPDYSSTTNSTSSSSATTLSPACKRKLYRKLKAAQREVSYMPKKGGYRPSRKNVPRAPRKGRRFSSSSSFSDSDSSSYGSSTHTSELSSSSMDMPSDNIEHNPNSKKRLRGREPPIKKRKCQTERLLEVNRKIAKRRRD